MSLLMFIILITGILFLATLVVGINGMKKAGHSDEVNKNF